MGIFEKIFEIGNTMIDVMQACGPNMQLESMYGVSQDPFEMFVKTLSQTPNSQSMYANLLMRKVEERPEVRRWSDHLMPEISGHGVGALELAGTVPFSNVGMLAPQPVRRWRGSIVGEITDDSVEKPEEGDDHDTNTAWIPANLAGSNDGESVEEPSIWM